MDDAPPSNAFVLVSRALLWCITLITYKVPKLALSILSYSGVITLKFTFTKLFILFAALSLVTSYYVKFKYLNRYTQLKEPPLEKDEGFELHPNVATEEAQGAGFNNYLDEFREWALPDWTASFENKLAVSAIRIFGYLEKPVFHELARHLQTRRLVAGDTLALESDHSFYIVIDGTVQVFVPDNSACFVYGESVPLEAYDHESTPGLQLLNEVSSGGTLSSLFTILSLFTEQIKLRYEDEPAAEDDSPDRFSLRRDISSLSLDRTVIPEEKEYSLDDKEAEEEETDAEEQNDSGEILFPRQRSTSVDGVRLRRRASMSSLHTITNSPDGAIPKTPQPGRRSSHRTKSAPSLPNFHPRESIIARAKTDTTLAVIPAHAFRHLTKKFPNAAAHIVQVILTRLSRVTLLTCHRYLGLTKELVRTEKAINDLACYPLPSEFYASGGMHRLRQRFVPETSAEAPEEHTDYFSSNLATSYYGPSLGRPTSRNDDTPGAAVKLRFKPKTPSSSSAKRPKLAAMSPQKTTSTGEPKIKSPLARNLSFVDHYDFDLRATVMDCISKSMGLISGSSGSDVASAEQSPTLFAQDSPSLANLSRPAFSSALGSLSYLGRQSKDDESSITALSASQQKDGLPELENEVEILFFPKGATLVKEGQSKAGVFYVIDGFLEVSMSENNNRYMPPHSQQSTSSRRAQQEKEAEEHPSHSFPLFTVKPGGIAGYLSSLTGYASYVSIKAKTDVYVGFLPANALERMMDRRPIVLLTLAKRLLSLLSPLILHIDLALEWVQVNAGQVIYKEGEDADSFYICLQGRVRAIIEQSAGGVDIKGEYGQGESVGELECITKSRRPSTLHAIRDTELVRMPAQLFNAIAIRHPSITVQMTQIIANRIRSETNSQNNHQSAENVNLRTVAIIPITHSIPITDFALHLKTALENNGAPTSYLNQATVIDVMGRHAFSRLGKLKLAGWLSDTEQKYRTVLYVADASVTSPWTQTCIRQADCILLVAYGAGSPQLGEYERLLVSMKTTARKELVLLHPERVVAAGSTRKFLRLRPWLHAHHHIEMAGSPEPHFLSAFKDPAPVEALKRMRDQVQIRLQSQLDRVQVGLDKFNLPVHLVHRRNIQAHDAPNYDPTHDDFARLARWLCGKSIGVVLGGGGARGISHVGTLRALQERGIPIDMIGGTSIGAFIGGLYAREGDLLTTHARAKRFSGRMSTLWRLATDLTYPIVSYTTGHEFNRGIFKSFYDLHIEDFWLPYFAVTTNITWSRMEVHTTGYAWRYIRASMSLAGLLPPLCDGGDMLLDGGYFDNLPVTVMLKKGASSVFAIDVGSIDDTSPRNFGDAVSGWWVLFARWWPWSNANSVPSLTEIQSRLTYVSSVKTLEEAKTTPGVLYMRQPVTEYGTMDFGKHNEIDKAGFVYASKCLDKWAKKGALPTSTLGLRKDAGGVRPKLGNRMRRASI